MVPYITVLIVQAKISCLTTSSHKKQDVKQTDLGKSEEVKIEPSNFKDSKTRRQFSRIVYNRKQLFRIRG